MKANKFRQKFVCFRNINRISKGSYIVKKLICITGIILIACAVTGNIFAPNADASAQTVQQSSAGDKQEEDVYVLKIEDGYLNVYCKESGKIYLHTGTMSQNLPKSDVMRLEKGVEIKGKESLRRAVEDYCS